jgi:hypothetical protein
MGRATRRSCPSDTRERVRLRPQRTMGTVHQERPDSPPRPPPGLPDVCCGGKNSQTKAPLWVDWLIEAKAGGRATLRLVHSGFSTGADWDDEVESYARGWRLMLANLRHYFSRHAKKPEVHVTFTAKADSPRESVWTTLLSKLGFQGTPKSGDAFRITIAGTDVLTGTIDLVNPARDLALVVHQLDDALLRFTLEGGGKSPSTFVYGYVIVR